MSFKVFFLLALCAVIIPQSSDGMPEFVCKICRQLMGKVADYINSATGVGREAVAQKLKEACDEQFKDGTFGVRLALCKSAVKEKVTTIMQMILGDREYTADDLCARVGCDVTATGDGEEDGREAGGRNNGRNNGNDEGSISDHDAWGERNGDNHNRGNDERNNGENEGRNSGRNTENDEGSISDHDAWGERNGGNSNGRESERNNGNDEDNDRNNDGRNSGRNSGSNGGRNSGRNHGRDGDNEEWRNNGSNEEANHDNNEEETNENSEWRNSNQDD